MAKQLLFLDIDGTLLDPQYKNNYPGLKNLILKLQKHDFVFCLNSNRALHDLLPVAKQFGIKGPLICENGLFAYIPDSQKEILLTGRDALNDLAYVKTNFQKWISESRSALGYEIKYTMTDTVKLVDTKASKFPQNTILVFDNKFRKYTISAHIRRFANQHLVKDLDSLDILRQILTENIKSHGLTDKIEIDSSETFGNLLIYSKLTSKYAGVRYLVKNVYPGYGVVAIGDEPSDANMVSGIGKFLTVGNASRIAKKLAAKVSHGSYANGVYELLSTIKL